MTSPATERPALRLRLIDDPEADFRREVERIRARGMARLADLIARAYDAAKRNGKVRP